jgi:hypothetical protein
VRTGRDPWPPAPYRLDAGQDHPVDAQGETSNPLFCWMRSTRWAPISEVIRLRPCSGARPRAEPRSTTTT